MALPGDVLAFVALLALAALVLVVRAWLLRRESPRRHHEPFDGVVYRVGEAAVAERRVSDPRATVVAMHGYVEDMRYFLGLYDDPSIQVITLTSCGYHVPVTDVVIDEPAWATTPTAPPGTIAYDAAVLVQALEHLPRSKTIRVHGHSRGGAVVLEASVARPDLFEGVEVVLEAPVLPRARSLMEPNGLMLWLYPFVIPLWKRSPLMSIVSRGFGRLDDARKRELLSAMPHNPKRSSICVANVADLLAWMRERDASMFAHVKRGVVLVASHDRVLDSDAMHRSATLGGPALEVVRVSGSSHFVALDRPDAFPRLAMDR
ncbi:MAG: alpha/beta fold hydrolase [Polyangiaceae bacterium]